MSMTTLMSPEQQASWRHVIAKAWVDPGFKSKLLVDPVGALSAAGIAWPAGLALHVHEATPTEVHLILPPRPADELDDELLDGIAGGTGSSHHSSSHHSSSHPSSSHSSSDSSWASDPGPAAMAAQSAQVEQGGNFSFCAMCSGI